MQSTNAILHIVRNFVQCVKIKFGTTVKLILITMLIQ